MNAIAFFKFFLPFDSWSLSIVDTEFVSCCFAAVDVSVVGVVWLSVSMDFFLFCDGGELVFWLWKSDLYMSDLFWDKEVEVGILWDDWFVCGEVLKERKSKL